MSLQLPLVVIRAAHPGMTLYARAIVDAMLLTEGGIGPAREVARRLGLRNRFVLARLLKRAGLPPLHRLAGWVTVLAWVRAAERTGVSLCYLAFHSRRHPSACYRLVKEVTGRCWIDVLGRGSRWVEEELLNQPAAQNVRAPRLSLG